MNKAIAIWIKTESCDHILRCFDGDLSITDDILPELKDIMGSEFDYIIEVDVSVIGLKTSSVASELMDNIKLFG